MIKTISKAATLLQDGEVVAIPTETVYGLAANAFNDEAVAQIFQIKNRPLFNPLIVHIKSIEYLDVVATNIPPIAYQLAHTFWPGPLTLVLEKKSNVSTMVTSGKNTLGVRMPSHPVALALLKQLDFPLAAPSANPFGYISPTTSEHVRSQLGDKIPYILEGGSCERGIESTIVGFDGNKPILYRVGAISNEEIESCIGKLTVINTASANPEAPGMINKHYSPRTKFVVSEQIAEVVLENVNRNVGFLFFKNENFSLPSSRYIELSDTKNLVEAASNLYAAMHRLDQMNLDVIYAEKFPDKGLGITINDRLHRAQEENFEMNITL
ncbi:L-threonylcarbamoyladenylate synthase [Flavobacterium nackdongense]|uniref:Threonylcarbamoyl-AMP synthase n=1 Tax=Flavobacterium nackdongense TaxID=2547394 RepID=A0A4P6YC37_9FLAO|nr:L-threonylcarbamoyladenylate synthase [Flavobacterium nackdongense]QBN18364.1 threonylcarbamoyl-AMP synthase [Flavobacterium nackdongense]